MADPAHDRDIRPSRARRLLFIVAGLTFAFLIGFGWQWLAARDYRAQADEANRGLTMERLATTLASAVIQADRGDFDAAREQASTFFTGLQSNVDQAESAEAAATFEEILARRDAVITSLSRSDPAAEDVLAQIFVRFRVATGGPDIALPISVPGSPEGAGDSLTPPPGG